jgi:uncharacterized protein
MQQTLILKDIKITGGFWDKILQNNAETAIFHQWNELENSGSIENFRIAAGESNHFRTGFFFSDSDVFKWLDAASRISIHYPSQQLKTRIDELTGLIRRAQEPDGYLYTYNQILFPGKHWIALQIEHELYCHGHLIEACLAHDLAFPAEGMLEVAIRAGDLICDVFIDKPAHFQPGHQEIELALLYLYERTGNVRYLEMARQFLARRGRVRGYSWRLLVATIRSGLRGQSVARREKAHRVTYPELTPFTLPPMNESHSDLKIILRFLSSSLSGKYFQTHRPIPDQQQAVGHSVRFGYTMAAETLRLRLEEENSDELGSLEALWQEMVTKRMYVTGGIGSLPVIEGFGRDYELDSKLAYAETCATIASLFWDWELIQSTNNPQYADLFEWQLYNAALVGVGMDGQSYLYNNPLASDGELTREPWFRIPCCPSNISRIFAALGSYLYTYDENSLTVQQYITSEMQDGTPAPMRISVESGFPFETIITIKVLQGKPNTQLRLRIPGWADDAKVWVNGKPVDVSTNGNEEISTAGGYSLFGGQYFTLPEGVHTGDRIEIIFGKIVRTLYTDPKVGLGKRDTAISYGPLVYCAEDKDNPNLDLDSTSLYVQSFYPSPSADLKGITMLTGEDAEGHRVRMIPYYAWANRGRSKMRVFFAQS